METSAIRQHYARDQRERGLRPRTITRCGDVLSHLDAYHPGRLCNLTTEDIRGWLNAVPRVDRTRAMYLSTVHNFYCWAIIEGHATLNPTVGIRRPRVHPGLPRPIRHDDLAHAVLFAPPMIRAWLLLAAYAGLRCQEIAGLEREDVLDHEDPAMLHVVHGKGGKQRMVPLHPEVLTALRVARLPHSGPLFRLPTSGVQYSPRYLCKVGNLYLHSVGVTSTMHQLRHRFGTDIYRASKDIRLTQDLLGHASPVTTAIYTQTSPLDAVAVVNALTIGAA